MSLAPTKLIIFHNHKALCFQISPPYENSFSTRHLPVFKTFLYSSQLIQAQTFELIFMTKV